MRFGFELKRVLTFFDSRSDVGEIGILFSGILVRIFEGIVVRFCFLEFWIMILFCVFI